jgi:hypothetical protein
VATHRAERRKLSGQCVGPLRDVAGAETHDDVAKVRGAIERNDLAVAVGAQALHQRVSVGTGDRRFASGVDVRHDHRVGVVEGGRELVEQRREPGIAVRLQHGDHLAAARFVLIDHGP